MSRHYTAGILVLAALGLGGWAMAQQPEAQPAPEAGAFSLIMEGDKAMLLDTKTGQAWELTHSVEGEPVWLPSQRLDDEDDVRKWKAREARLGRSKRE